MSFYEHDTEFAGRPVVEWTKETALTEPSAAAYRIAVEYESGETVWREKFQSLTDHPQANGITHLVFGPWWDVDYIMSGAEKVVEAIAAAGPQLPNLKAIFIGDIISEENEISWIEQTDIAPVLAACPQLEHLRVRGGNGLRFSNLRHENLKSLVIETGGLSATTVRDITSAHLPNLEHLELWLGSDNYGGNAEIVDLAPLFTGKLFPRLTYLGLRDSEKADAIAAAVAHAPVMEQLRVLDLSLGTLRDEGAAALLASPLVARLERLDLHHHFCSDEMTRKLATLGPQVDASEQQEADEYNGELYYYISVSE